MSFRLWKARACGFGDACWLGAFFGKHHDDIVFDRGCLYRINPATLPTLYKDYYSLARLIPISDIDFLNSIQFESV